jgi:hypothetical protein
VKVRAQGGCKSGAYLQPTKITGAIEVRLHILQLSRGSRTHRRMAPFSHTALSLRIDVYSSIIEPCLETAQRRDKPILVGSVAACQRCESRGYAWEVTIMCLHYVQPSMPYAIYGTKRGTEESVSV